jgi:hypothetical protein
MSSWEDRMAAAAHERWLQRQETWYREQRVMAADRARQLAEEQCAEFEAGPPDGCRECYHWVMNWVTDRYMWGHAASAQPGPAPEDYEGASSDTDWCHHACHGGEPVFCGPIPIAAIITPHR